MQVSERVKIGDVTCMPRLVEPSEEGMALSEWMQQNLNQVEAILAESGAILFRGFGIFTDSMFKAVADSATKDRLKYIYRSTPRREVEDRIYTATEYPKEFEIPLHNENSYQRDWPMWLMFCCIQPAQKGGSTPLASTERITQRIDHEIREMAKRKKVMYVRNYGQGIDLPWETVFQTDQKGEVEQYCKDHAVDFEWLPHNCLRTKQVCQAMARHPRTGQELWFNQAHLFHVSSLDEKTRSAMLKLLPEDELPRNAYFGDGSPISPDILDHIRAAYEVEKCIFPWQRGDVLLLDNMLLCHGRTSFEG